MQKKQQTNPMMELQSGRYNKGLTLIELMTAVAILGILLAAGIPMFRTSTINSSIDQAFGHLRIDIDYARNLAVDKSTEVRVEPVSADNWQSGWVVRSDNEIFRFRSAFNAAVTITSDDFDQSTPISFTPSGRATTVGVISVDMPGCTGDRERNIQLLFSGQVDITEALCTD